LKGILHDVLVIL